MPARPIGRASGRNQNWGYCTRCQPDSACALDPVRVKVAAPPEPKLVKDGVQSDLNSPFLILGGVSLLVGAIGIANVTLVSVTR